MRATYFVVEVPSGLVTVPMVHIFGHPIDIPKGISEAESEQLTQLLQSRLDKMREMAASFFTDAETYNFKN